MAAAMSAHDPFQLDGRVVFLFGGDVAIALGNAGATLILDGRNLGRSEVPGHVLANRAPSLVRHGVDGGRRMDGLVG
jgi:hypothetical protein